VSIASKVLGVCKKYHKIYFQEYFLVDFNFGQNDEEEAGLSPASMKSEGKIEICKKYRRKLVLT
jgi:hypothetical protein